MISKFAPQVRGEGTGTLGSLSLPLSELLQADRLCLDKWFALSNGQGQVLMRAQLGVSTVREAGAQDLGGLRAEVSGGGSRGGGSGRSNAKAVGAEVVSF